MVFGSNKKLNIAPSGLALHHVFRHGWNRDSKSKYVVLAGIAAIKERKFVNMV